MMCIVIMKLIGNSYRKRSKDKNESKQETKDDDEWSGIYIRRISVVCRYIFTNLSISILSHNAIISSGILHVVVCKYIYS